MGRQRKGLRVLGPYTRKDGRFSVVVKGPRLEGGTDTKRFYFQTETEALSLKEEVEADFKRQIDTTLAEAVRLYLDDELSGERQLKQSTISEARARLNPLIRLAPTLVTDVRPEDIKERLAQLPSAASQRGTLARMNDFFNSVVEAKLVRSNPCDGFKVKAKAKRGKLTLTRTEARTFDEHLWTEVETAGVDAEVAAAIILLLYLGLRRAELLRLQVRDIDIDSTPAVLAVEREAKTVQGLREMELPPRVAAMLADLVGDKNLTDWLWPSPKSADGHRGGTWLLKGTKRLCRAAGVTEVCPQGLRGTHSKLARKAGMTAHAIQAQLGHEDARTTTESYITEKVETQELSRRAQSVLRGE